MQHRLSHIQLQVLVCFCVVVLASALFPARTQAIQVPPVGSVLFIQTNGPLNPILNGDWYTNDKNGVGSGYHYFSINVPCGWPANLPFDIDFYSPEINTFLKDGTEGSVVDEIERSAPNQPNPDGLDNTTFELYNSSVQLKLPNQPGPGVTGSLKQVTYKPVRDRVESWTRFYTIPAVDETNCGSYILRAETSTDDQNSWKLRIGYDKDGPNEGGPPNDNPDGLPGTGDEASVGIGQTTYQHNVRNTIQCLTLYEFVARDQDKVTFRNFDLDNNRPGQRVRYYSPSATYDPQGITGGVAGTVSENAKWNNGTTTDKGQGDVITNPEPGLWRLVTCVTSDNQFNQEGQSDVFFYDQPPPRPEMALSKTDGVDTALPAEVLTYTLSFTNTSNILEENRAGGPGAAYNVVLTDTIPPGTSYVNCGLVAPITGTCELSGTNMVIFRLNGIIKAGDSGKVQVTTKINPGFSGTLLNNAILDFRDSIGNQYPEVQASDVTTVPPVRDLQITKTDNGVTTDAGQTLAYTLNYINVGGQPATNVVITERIPEYTTFDAATSPAGWSCANGAPAGTTCSYTVGSLAAGASGTIGFAVRVDDQLPRGLPEITNGVRIDDQGSNEPDPTPQNNASSVRTRIPPKPELVSSKSDRIVVDNNGDGKVSPADVIEYTIVITNNGLGNAADVRFTDAPDPNTTLVVGTVQVDSSTATIVRGNNAGDADIDIAVGTIGANGGAMTVVFQVRVNDGIPMGIDFVANQGLINGSNTPQVPTDDPETPDVPNDSTRTPLVPPGPAAIDLVSFKARTSGDGTVVTWVTGAEYNTFGFQIYRSTDSSRANAVQVAPALVLAQPGTGGATYTWTDTTALADTTYYYWLVEVDTQGVETTYGPITVLAPDLAAQTTVFLPIVTR